MTAELTQPQPGATKRIPRRICLAAIVVLATFVAVHLIRSSGSIHRELAAIEATRAIPDSENAAPLYYKILDEYPLTLPEFFPPLQITGSPPHDALSQMAEFTAYLAYVPMLQHAAKIKECRLSLSLDPKIIIRRRAVREEMEKWVRLLSELAKRDEALGRFDAAFDKYTCMSQMANHCYQQRTREGMFVAASPEGGALGGFNRLIANGNASETQLTTIDEVTSQIQADWQQAWPQIQQVEELYALYWKRQLTLRRRLSKIRIDKKVHYEVLPFSHYPAFPKVYRRRLSWRRGIRILVALQRYKDRNGRWPQSLEDLASVAPEEIFIDPVNDGKFVYKIKPDTFVLYSKGKDAIDQHVEWDFSHPMYGPGHPKTDDTPIHPALAWHVASPDHIGVTEPHTHTEQTQ